MNLFLLLLAELVIASQAAVAVPAVPAPIHISSSCLDWRGTASPSPIAFPCSSLPSILEIKQQGDFNYEFALFNRSRNPYLPFSSSDATSTSELFEQQQLHMRLKRM